MNTLKCGIGDCPSVFETEDALSPKARYVCKLHSQIEQRIFFQEHQFDKDLRIAKSPQGTSHIPRQGSNVMTAEDIEQLYSWQKSEDE
jgi:hypothetical protein